MFVPLSVNPIVKYGKEKLDIWYDDRQKIIDSPILPYFYSYRKLDLSDVIISQVKAKALSNCQEKIFYKYEFNTRQELEDCRDSLVDTYGLGITFEDHIKFILRNRIDNPDLYKKFPHTKPLIFLFIDVEQYTKPGALFPDYGDRIISISYCTNDRNIKTIFLRKETTTDKDLLLKLIEIYNEIKPNVIVVYNQKYDIPTIMNRCLKTHIDVSHFSKNEEKPKFSGYINIPGCVIYDVLLSAQADQSLSGKVMNRGLKEVSDYYGFKTEYKTLIPKEISESVGTDELINYNKDDIRRLLLLFDIYWPNIEFNANDLGLPLNACTDLSVTDLSYVVLGDEYKKQNIISDGSNYVRYPDIFQRQKSQEDSNYQGAITDIAKTGLFKPLYKADYGSMYPTIESSFNLSPDTTTLLMFAPYDGVFKIKEEEYWYIYEVPDDVLNKNMIIQVLKKEGFISSLVSRFLKERSEYKKLFKQTGEKRYESMSNNRKVKANGTYGIMGNAKHAFGFVPIAVATTGIGREGVILLTDVLEELYPNCIIERDTDGIYFTTDKFNKEDVWKLFDKRLKEKFKKDLNLSIDFDEYDSGFFYLSKNYILRKREKIILHGAALTASSKDLLCKSLIHELAVAKLNEQPTEDIIRRYQKLDFPLNYFALNTTLGMPLSRYKNPYSTLVSRLAMEARDKLGIPPTVGQQYHYVKSNIGYTLYELSSINDLDRNYYLDEINKLVELFQEKAIVRKVDDWL